LMEHFFDRATSDGWRAQFLRDYGITYVFVTPKERFSSTTRFLSPIYQADGYTVYQVVSGQ